MPRTDKRWLRDEECGMTSWDQQGGMTIAIVHTCEYCHERPRRLCIWVRTKKKSGKETSPPLLLLQGLARGGPWNWLVERACHPLPRSTGRGIMSLRRTPRYYRHPIPVVFTRVLASMHRRHYTTVETIIHPAPGVTRAQIRRIYRVLSISPPLGKVEATVPVDRRCPPSLKMSHWWLSVEYHIVCKNIQKLDIWYVYAYRVFKLLWS